MDIKIAAKNMLDFIDMADLPEYDPAFGRTHLYYMAYSIVDGQITGEKAHRWLGWIQGCLCMSGCVSLEEMKQNNKEA